MSDARPTPPEPSRASARRLSNLFIAAFLAFQTLMPLRYYLGERGYDERFSWRMFSTIRLQQCAMQISESVASGTNGTAAFRDIQVRRDVQAAWVNLLERVRMPVVEKYLNRRCDRQNATHVRYSRRCTDTDGTALPIRMLELECASRELREVQP